MAFQRNTSVVVTALPSPGFGKHRERQTQEYEARGIAGDGNSVPLHRALPARLPAKASSRCPRREAVLGQAERFWCSPWGAAGHPSHIGAAPGPVPNRGRTLHLPLLQTSYPVVPCASTRNPGESYAEAQIMQVRFKWRCRKQLSIPASAGEWAPQARGASASKCQDKLARKVRFERRGGSLYSKRGALDFQSLEYSVLLEIIPIQ